MNDPLDEYLRQQKEAFLVLPLDSRTAYLNDPCYRLFFTSSKDKVWFPLHCSISQQVVSGISHLGIAFDGGARHSRTLSERVVEAMEGEQGRLSREVHDGMLQCVIGARMLLDRILAEVPRQSPQFESLLDVEECLAQANSEGRRLLENLRPAAIDELGLADALKLFLERLRREHPIEFDLEIQCPSGRRFPPEVRSNLYRILQEGVYNAVKHSGSSRVRVTLGQGNDEAWGRVEDWGVGFEVEPAQARSASGHMGLSSLRERVSLLGGRCQIASRPNLGTTIEVEVPLETSLESGFSNLRSRARAILERRPSDGVERGLVAELGSDEVAALLHEFEVHRTELEVQNNELRLAQRALITSRDRFRALYEHTTLGYLELDLSGRIVSANRTLSSLLGRPHGELLGQTVDSLVAPEFRGECRSPGCREIKVLRKAEPGWFWARLKTRRFAEKQLHVSVEELSAEHREAEEVARFRRHLELSKRKEAIASSRCKSLSSLLMTLTELGHVELVGEVEASLEQAVFDELRGLVATETETPPTFPIDTCLKETLSALSLSREFDRLTCLPDADGAVLSGDPILFGVLLEKLIDLVEVSLISGEGRITVSTGFLNIDEQKTPFLEVSGVGAVREPASGVYPDLTRTSGLKQLVENFRGKVSSFQESNRGTTTRILFP